MQIKRLLILIVLLNAAFLTFTNKAYAACSDNPFIGSICLVGFTFCPRGYAEANGQLLQISSNTALFSLFGTTYGGDGRTTFGLPDLRGRAPIGWGQGAGLNNYVQGSRGGQETVTLNAQEIPSHNHSATLSGTSVAADTELPGDSSLSPAGAYMLSNSGRSAIYNKTETTTNTDMHSTSVTVANSGGGQAHENRPPYLTLRYCVALVGLFPSRS